jgi:hypothetical protein
LLVKLNHQRRDGVRQTYDPMAERLNHSALARPPLVPLAALSSAALPTKVSTNPILDQTPGGGATLPRPRS